MDKSEFNKSAAVVLPAGQVEYSAAKAAAPIDELIEALEDAKRSGAEFVLMGSGNYRGAKWQSLPAEWSWAEEVM